MTKLLLCEMYEPHSLFFTNGTDQEMAVQGRFGGFEPYTLSGVRVREEELGRGSYAAVILLEYRGLKCAGKRIYRVLYEQGVGDIVRRFENECRLLSQTRHPNIVQFLGVFFEEGSRVPILVMEFLPTTLASCIDSYGVLPPEISYSILYDVALGLYYLHSHSPPIIHRDLSANNVLLTDSMTAKISDLGVSRIVNLNPLQITHLTGAPGTPAYMPPETFSANPRYNTSMDVFSFGIMLIHVFSGRWPFPLCEATRPNPRNRSQLIAVSEVDRRNEYLDQIGRGHPLMGLILRCIGNDPGLRGTAQEIVQRMEAMVHQFQPAHANKIEMLQQQESLRTEVERLAGEVEQKERVELAHCIEIKQLHLQVTELNADCEALTAEKDVEITELKSQKEAEIVSLRSQKEAEIASLRSQKEAAIACLRSQKEAEIASLRSQKEAEIAVKEAEVLINVVDLSAKDQELTAKDATLKRMNQELASKNATLERKSAAIRGLNDQLSRAREYLSSNLQPHHFQPPAKINWKECSKCPMRNWFQGARTVVIGDKVYVGSGAGFTTTAQAHHVFSYSLSEDVWNSLPDCPVRGFGMGQLEGRVVAVGGARSALATTNKVYVLDEDSQSWKDSIIPPMIIPRCGPAVLSHHSSLIVAGGGTPSGHTSAVELFRRDTSQWHRTCPLPFPCSFMSSVVIQNAAYLLGGFVGSVKFSNRVVYASVDSLLQKSLPPDQTSEDSDSVWKTLPNTPRYGSAAATISGCLLAVGGENRSNWILTPQKEVYIYSPSTASWLHVSDLPSPRHATATAMISPMEFLVIHGKDNAHNVYKASLEIHW